ncbi:MAG: GtrA family protein [Prevotella sp.]|nr:GtrA family protein [Prevotella sp.]
MRLRREEWIVGLAVMLLLIILNGMLIAKYDALFSVVCDDYGKLLSYHYHVSGFDATTYSVLTEWGMKYDVLRHPLLPYLMYLPYQLNQLLIAMAGVNGALYIAAAIILFFGFCTTVLLYRILRELVGLGRWDATLLTVFFFSCAYVLVTYIATDHFAISLFLILLSVYLIGRASQQGRVLKTWQTVLLVVITSGVTLTNAAKIYAAELVARGKGFFRWRFLLPTALCGLLMVGMGLWEERVYVYPKEQAEKKYFEEHREEMMQKARENHQRYKHAPWVIHKGKPFGKGSLLKWTDKTTSRWETLKENVFGESLLLHEDYVLDDILTSYRPVLLSYRSVINYVVEGVLVFLLLAGICCGFREKLLWMCLLGILPDALMHIGLGFAINEIYIMSAHWVYIFPIALAYLLKARSQRLMKHSLRVIIVLLTAYLLIHNLVLIIGWMQQPPVSIAFWYD